MEVPQKLNIEISYDPVILPWGIYQKKRKTLIEKDICALVFSAALCTIAKLWKQPSVYREIYPLNKNFKYSVQH